MGISCSKIDSDKGSQPPVDEDDNSLNKDCLIAELEDENQKLKNRVAKLEAFHRLVKDIDTGFGKGIEKGIEKALADTLTTKNHDDDVDAKSFDFSAISKSNASVITIGEGATAKVLRVTNSIDNTKSALKCRVINEPTQASFDTKMENAILENKLHAMASANPVTAKFVTSYRTCYLVELSPENNDSLKNLVKPQPSFFPETVEAGVSTELQNGPPSPLSSTVSPTSKTHSNLFPYHAILITSMEHCNRGSLLDYQTSLGKTFGEDSEQYFKLILPLLPRVIDIVESLHSIGIVHRDVQTRNIFLSKSPNGELSSKISDFGESREREAYDNESDFVAEDVSSTKLFSLFLALLFANTWSSHVIQIKGLGQLIFDIFNEILSTDDAEYDNFEAKFKADGLIPFDWGVEFEQAHDLFNVLSRSQDKNVSISLKSFKVAVTDLIHKIF